MNIQAQSAVDSVSPPNADLAIQRYRALVEAAHDGILTIDAGGTVTLFNQAAELMFGFGADEVIGEPLTKLLPVATGDVHAQHVADFAHSPVQHRGMTERNEVHGRRKDGTEFAIQISLAKIEVDGAIEFTAVMRNVSRQTEIIAGLREQAVTDPLTGLKNRYYLDERGCELKSLADRYGMELSVMMLDIDHFKKINDRFGHAVGDHVLQALARTTENMLRKSDILARVGGEEFVILMPETKLAQARLVGERLRRRFVNGSLPLALETAPVPFTVSIGITRYRTGEDDALADTINRADTALYLAKEQGRDRIVIADEPEDSTCTTQAG